VLIDILIITSFIYLSIRRSVVCVETWTGLIRATSCLAPESKRTLWHSQCRTAVARIWHRQRLTTRSRSRAVLTAA